MSLGSNVAAKEEAEKETEGDEEPPFEAGHQEASQMQSPPHYRRQKLTYNDECLQHLLVKLVRRPSRDRRSAAEPVHIQGIQRHEPRAGDHQHFIKTHRGKATVKSRIPHGGPPIYHKIVRRNGQLWPSSGVGLIRWSAFELAQTGGWSIRKDR